MPDTEDLDSHEHTVHRVASTDASTPQRSGSRQMDSRMMWVMMIGCCLALPVALIIGGASLGGLAGVSPWLIGAGVALAVALVITRRLSNDTRCDAPADTDR